MNGKSFLTGRPNLRNFLCALLSGALLIIAWPPHRAGFLIFIAFVPFIYAIDRSTKQKRVFLNAFTAMLLWAIGSMNWEAGIITVHTSVKLFFFIPSFFIVALLFTLPVLVWKRLSKYLNNYVWWFSLALLWTAYEFLTGKGDLAMNWLNLEFGLSYYPRLIRFTEYIGPHGTAMAVMLVNILLYLVWKHRKEKKPLRILSAALGFLIISLFVMDILPSGSGNGKSIAKKIAVIQPDWLSYYTPDKNAFKDELDTLEKLALPLAGQHPDLIVCSEGFIHHQSAETHPILIDGIDSDRVILRLKSLSARLHAPIITGIELAKIYFSNSQPTITAQYIRPGYYYDTYNAAILVSPDGPLQIYVKNKLCPFIERVPFLGFFSFFNGADSAINKKIISYASIQQQDIFRYGDMRIAPAICWESSFPDYITRMIRKSNANMVAVVSSNFSLGEMAAHIDEAYCIPLAVKTQCPLVRAANTGISCFIDKNGTVQQASGWKESKVLVQDIELNSSPTFYVKYGDLAGRFSFYAFLLLTLYPLFCKMTYKYGVKEKPKARKKKV